MDKGGKGKSYGPHSNTKTELNEGFVSQWGKQKRAEKSSRQHPTPDPLILNLNDQH